jgi:large subunit ribosomal protein L18
MSSTKYMTRRQRRHRRIRKKISGTAERARLAVFRSNQHIYAQVVDDTKGIVLAAASDLKLGDVQAAEGETRGVSRAKAVGRELASRAKEKGVESVAFDRGGYKYHGRVAALAEGAREGGLKF